MPSTPSAISPRDATQPAAGRGDAAAGVGHAAAGSLPRPFAGLLVDQERNAAGQLADPLEVRRRPGLCGVEIADLARPRRSTWGRGRAGRRRRPACHQIRSPDRDRCGTHRSRAWASPGTSRPDRRPPPGSRRPPAGGRRARRARDGSGTRSAGSVPPPRRCRRSRRRPRRRRPARCRRSAEPDRAGHGRRDERGHSGRRARPHRRRGPCVPAPRPAGSCRCPRAPAPTRSRLGRRPRPPRRPRATPDRPRGRRTRDPPP